MILDSNGILNESVGLKRFVMDSNFFIQTINSKFESQNQGFYKIFNDLNDFKKILYLSILIEKVLSNNYEVLLQNESNRYEEVARFPLKN